MHPTHPAASLIVVGRQEHVAHPRVLDGLKERPGNMRARLEPRARYPTGGHPAAP